MTRGTRRWATRYARRSFRNPPYIVVIGEKEANARKVAVRAHGGKDLGVMELPDFKAMLLDKISSKSMD